MRMDNGKQGVVHVVSWICNMSDDDANAGDKRDMVPV